MSSSGNNTEAVRPDANMVENVPYCNTCGHITVRNGSVYRCLNCGEEVSESWEETVVREEMGNIVEKTKVVIVGAHGKKLGAPVLESITNSNDIQARVGIISPKDPRLVPYFGCTMYRSFHDVPEDTTLDRKNCVVFYAIKGQDLGQCLNIATAKGFRRHVIGSTGIPEDVLGGIQASGGSNLFVLAPNFSEGANRCAETCAEYAQALPDARVEIIEMHHEQKQDAPSGTALFWARAIAAVRGHAFKSVVKYGPSGKGKRAPQDICIHSVRGGTISGSHRALFFSGDEVYAVEHAAGSSAAFVKGALKAICWAALPERQQGLHHMYNVFDLPLLKRLRV
jgi:4-hydroxy-tetrahydrodipicolinate reductase